MDGLMMDYQLNVPAILRRADELYGESEIASRLPDKSWHRYSYADFVSRTKKLVVALRKLGIEDGDRVGTFMWNHSQHLETYIGAPVGGFVTHTLNLRLHPDDNTYIATHGGDRVLIVDKVLWPLAEQFVGRCKFEHVIAVGDGPTPNGAVDYEELLAEADESEFSYRDLPERSAAAMCYTSGTTGRPKGVLYSHRAIAIHALTVITGLGFTADDVCLPVVPMFHANAWCFPYSCTMTGVKQVFPGPHLDPVSLLEAFQQEKVTVTAGVPTIWMGILQTLDADPNAYDVSSIKYMTVGGAAPPRAMIEAFRRAPRAAHGPRLGDDRDEPGGTLSGAPGQEAGLSPRRRTRGARCRGFRSRSARSAPAAPRGSCPGTARRWASSRCAARRSPRRTSSPTRVPTAGRTTAGSGRATWSRSTRTASSRCRIAKRTSSSRAASGSRRSRSRTRSWGTPSVAEAAVIAIPDEKWSERPLAVVVLREGEEASPDELREFLAPSFAKWWLPEKFEFVDEIPKTAVGKFRKTALREQFAKQPAETA